MTNYEKYFGTPEKVIESTDNMGSCPLGAIEGFIGCSQCKYKPVASIKCEQGQLEWLQEECDGAAGS